MRVLMLLLGCGLAFAQTMLGPRYTDSGQLLLPEDYREWVFLSSGLGMTYGPLAQGQGAPPSFDNVFVQPEAYRAFRETGRWPDQTVFILEVRYSASHGSINRGGHFQTDIAGIEAHVKDAKRFPEKSAFFDFRTRGGIPAKTGRPLGKEAGCFACHSANGAVDHTFVQFYPAMLEAAERKGTLRADYKPFVPSPARLFHVIRDQGWPAAEQELAKARAEDPGAAILNQGIMNGLGYQLLEAKEMAGALGVLEWVAAANPGSANAQDSLADAYAAAGEKDKALRASRKALSLLSADQSLNESRRAALEMAIRKRMEALGTK
jgi:hypothetical protein